MRKPKYEVLLRKPSNINYRIGGPFSREERSEPVTLPNRCVFCLKPAAGSQGVSGDKNSLGPGYSASQHIELPIPYCEEHLDILKKGGAYPGSAAPKIKINDILISLIRIFFGLFLVSLFIYALSSPRADILSLGVWRLIVKIVWLVSLGLMISLAIGGYLFNSWRVKKWMKETPEGQAETERWKIYQELTAAVQVRPKGDWISLKFSNKEFADEFRNLNKNRILR